MAVGRLESNLWAMLVGLTIVGGSFSLSRLDPQLASLGLWDHFAMVAAVGWVLVWLLVLVPRTVTGSIDLMATAPPLRVQLALFFLLHLYVILSATWAVRTDMTLVRVVQLLMMMIVTGTGIMLLPLDVERAVDTYLRFFAVLGVVAVLGTIPFYLTSPALQRGIQEQFTLGDSGGANTLARNFGIALVATLSLSRSGGRLWWALVPVLLGAVFLTGSRSGSLATVVGVTVFIATSGSGHRGPALLTIAAAAVAAPFVLGQLGLAEAASLTWQQRFLEHTFRDWNVADRDVLFDYAIRLWKLAPLFGVGLTGYASHLALDTSLNEPYSHNLFLDFLSEGGLAGVGLAAACLLSFVGSKRSAASARSAACLGMAFVNGTSAMFSGSYFDARFLWFALFLFAALRYHKPGSELAAAAA